MGWHLGTGAADHATAEEERGVSVQGCPACGSDKLHAHCPSFTCLWVTCDDCGGYGYLDGSRWKTGTAK